MWLVSAYSLFTIALPWRSAFALVFYTGGSAIVLAGVLTFRRMKTTVNPLTPEATTTMVTSSLANHFSYPSATRWKGSDLLTYKHLFFEKTRVGTVRKL